MYSIRQFVHGFSQKSAMKYSKKVPARRNNVNSIELLIDIYIYIYNKLNVHVHT